MIYAELSGGLGNQMFVYAFARQIKLRARRHWKQRECVSSQCRTTKKPVSAHCTSI